MTTEWFVRANDEWNGPYSSAALKALASSGRLKSLDLIRKGQNGKPIPANKVGNLFPANHAPSSSDLLSASKLPASMPPLPATSRKSHEPPPLPGNNGRQQNFGTNQSDEVDDPFFSHKAMLDLNADVSSPEDAKSDIGAKVKLMVNELASLDYQLLLPFKKLFSASLHKRKAFRWIAVFGIFPLLLLALKKQFGWTFEECSWFIGGYFCLFWATLFQGILQPSHLIWRRGIRWALFIVCLGIPLLLFAQELPFVKALYSTIRSGHFEMRVLGFVCGVGVFEELTKASPFLLFSLRKRESLSLYDAVFLGMMCGFGFALAEGVQYSISYWGKTAQLSAVVVANAIGNSQAANGSFSGNLLKGQLELAMPVLVEHYGQMVLVQIVRFMTLPLLHAMWSGIVAWFIAMASRRNDRPQWPVILVGIAFVAVLHGLYDVFSDGVLGVGIAFLSVVIFMGYLLHSQDMSAQADS